MKINIERARAMYGIMPALYVESIRDLQTHYAEDYKVSDRIAITRDTQSVTMYTDTGDIVCYNNVCDHVLRTVITYDGRIALTVYS